jgi:hypothetical protein
MASERSVLQLISGIRINERRTSRAGEAVYGIAKLVFGDPLIGPTTTQRERFAATWGARLQKDYQILRRQGERPQDAAQSVFDKYFNEISGDGPSVFGSTPVRTR